MTDNNTGKPLVDFEWSLRALAQPATIQRMLFPEFVCVADELALEFEECLRAVRKAENLIPQLASEPIEALDARLAEMSGPTHLELWTDEALASMPLWEEIRQQARVVLEAMQWPATAPAPSKRIYVGEGPRLS